MDPPPPPEPVRALNPEVPDSAATLRLDPPEPSLPRVDHRAAVPPETNPLDMPEGAPERAPAISSLLPRPVRAGSLLDGEDPVRAGASVLAGAC
jgi:hypothetical protein